MSTPFLAELRIMSFNFAPKGWAMCNGQTMPINENEALFSLLGTTYGGNGQTTFALPNLQGRVAMHLGSGHTQGERAGEEAHTVIQSEMPAHTHPAQADAKQGNATTDNPNAAYPAYTTGNPTYSSGSTNMVAMYPQMVSNYGGSQPHENRQPFLTLNVCIALQGIFPSRS
jgi:microcystin-dependent protein